MTENKATSPLRTFVIKPISLTESKNALRESKKNQVKESLIAKLNEAICTAEKSVDENTLKPLNRIFTITPNKKTMIKLRYGSKVFFDGILDQMIVKDAYNGLKCDDYEAKKIVLKQIMDTINSSEYDSMYESFLSKKSSTKSSKKGKNKEESK